MLTGADITVQPKTRSAPLQCQTHNNSSLCVLFAGGGSARSYVASWPPQQVSPEVKQRLCFQLWAWATSCAGHLGSVSNFFYIHNKEGELPELLSCNSFPFLFRQWRSSQLRWAWNCFQAHSKPSMFMQRWRSTLHDDTPVRGLGLIILNDWRGSKSFCPTFQVT